MWIGRAATTPAEGTVNDMEVDSAVLPLRLSAARKLVWRVSTGKIHGAGGLRNLITTGRKPMYVQ